jgi:glycosyltransferase involved in cell wall biosynthesis
MARMSPGPQVDRAGAAHAVRRFRTVSGVDAVLRKVSRPRLRPLAELPDDAIRVLLYSPANLNQVDGSTIWVQSVVETLLAGPQVRVTVPLRAPQRRTVVSGPLARLERVEVVDAHPRLAARNLGLTTTQALDLIERLDRDRPFDAIVLRSFQLCLRATERPSLRDRVWSAYILEPERDLDDPAYRAEMARIARFSRHVVVQSEAMRSLLGSAVPEARGRTILLPPAIPDEPVVRADPGAPVRRLLYTGKFHPFYPVDRMIDATTRLRAGGMADLEFHVAGDKIVRLPEDPDYAPSLEQRLRTTPGVVWHGGLSREATARLLGEGGVALSLWDYRYGSHMNDLVVSTKLLDYAAVGLPVVLTRTSTQEALLGSDYPLFVDDLDDTDATIRRVFDDPALYREAAERTFEASRSFTYSAVHAAIAPDLAAAAAPRLEAAVKAGA